MVEITNCNELHWNLKNWIDMEEKTTLSARVAELEGERDALMGELGVFYHCCLKIQQ